MPGAPPPLEVGELANRGFSIANMDLIERDGAVAKDLVCELGRAARVFNTSIERFLINSSSYYSYIHLDYCGQLTSGKLADVSNAISHLEVVSRIRVTISKVRSNLYNYVAFYNRAKGVYGPFELTRANLVLASMFNAMVAGGYNPISAQTWFYQDSLYTPMLSIWVDLHPNKPTIDFSKALNTPPSIYNTDERK